MRKMVVASMALGLLLVAGAAQAEDKFGTGIILGADRLWGIGMYSITETTKTSGQPDVETKESATPVNLFFGGQQPSVYHMPRLAFDYGLGNGLTVGGSLGFSTMTPKSKQTKPEESSEQEGAKTSAWFIAPRVGYALELAEGIYIWPRAGITYYSGKSTTKVDAGTSSYDVESTRSGFGLNIEGMLLWSPVPHFGLTIGPVIDYTLSGSTDRKITPTPPVADDSERSFKEMNIGLASGVVGWF